jgi:hypothetical protein
LGRSSKSRAQSRVEGTSRRRALDFRKGSSTYEQDRTHAASRGAGARRQVSDRGGARLRRDGDRGGGDAPRSAGAPRDQAHAPRERRERPGRRSLPAGGAGYGAARERARGEGARRGKARVRGALHRHGAPHWARSRSVAGHCRSRRRRSTSPRPQAPSPRPTRRGSSTAISSHRTSS